MYDILDVFFFDPLLEDELKRYEGGDDDASPCSFEPLALGLEHAPAGTLDNLHRDPFDRMLAAQAEIEDIPLITADTAFRHFKVQILW